MARCAYVTRNTGRVLIVACEGWWSPCYAASGRHAVSTLKGADGHTFCLG